jgi:acyl-CoA reductase-like NAD-dependent aldehyde dehydrogenase
MQVAKNFIGGEFVEAADRSSFPSYDPTTGLQLAEVANSDVIDLVKAIQSANKAFVFWQKTDASLRAHILQAFAKALETERSPLAAIESQETGVPVSVVEESISRAVECIGYYARLILTESAEGFLSSVATEHGSSVQQFLERRNPIGVVGVITSWVEVVFGLASRIAPALAAGNVLIVKPSSRAPLTAQAFTEILARVFSEIAASRTSLPAGFSSSVFNLLQGRGAQVGRALAAHPGISTISFIGRTDTGRDVQAAGAMFLKRIQLSLSGSNAILVFAENDLEKTAAAVIRLSLTSETNASIRGARILVQESIYKEFLDVLKAQIGEIKIGAPKQNGVRLGPLISIQAKDAFHAAVSQASVEKGKILFGGSMQPEGLEPELKQGNFVVPTGIYDLTLCSTLQQEEILGPLVLISSFKYQNDAVKVAGNSHFGQITYLFNRDTGKATKLALKIESGRVFINPQKHLWDVRTHFGGWKASGIGGEGGSEGLRFFYRCGVLGLDL